MLEVLDLKKSFGDAQILDGVTFQVRPRERVALVGRNGTGKSTLLRMIAGMVEPDSGTIRMATGWSVAYLPQDGVVGSSLPLGQEMLGVFGGILELEARQRRLEEEMSGLAPADPRLRSLIDEHAALHAEFERRDGYTVAARIGEVLSGLGFRPEDHERRVDQLSGGWQMRAALAKLLLAAADVLLLDEPTNHLDMTAVEWLEEYLQRYRGAVLIVSHDRYLLDRAATRTLEVEDGVVAEYAGNYSYYVQERERRRAAQAASFQRQQEYLTEQTAYIERFRASAKRASQVKSREKMLDRLERVEAPREAREMVFRLPPCPPSGRLVISLRNASKSYGDLVVLAGLDLMVENGEKIGLVGPNGAGKSTLLRLMGRLERPDRGSVTHGDGVRIAYYAQNQAEALDSSKTVLQEVYGGARNGASVGEIRGLLGRMLFSRDDVFKPVSALSGGERSRVALAKMLLRPANLLLLDEPTNHLDVSAREVVEEALANHDGTVVVASHDRFFLDSVTTKTIEVQAGATQEYLGNYSYYRQQKIAQAIAAAAAVVTLRRPSRTAARLQSGRQADVERSAAVLEQEMAEAERRVSELAHLLGQPEAYAGGQHPSDLLAEYEGAVERLRELSDRWEALVEAL